jgi:hypothetical protein
MVNAESRANIFQYRSAECSRVTRWVLAAELYAINLGFDSAFFIRHTLERMLRRKLCCVPSWTASKTLFDCVTKISPISEKHLLIYLFRLRESYDNELLTELTWISGSTKHADALTKSPVQKTSPLQNALTKNLVSATRNEWVQKDTNGELQVDAPDKAQAENFQKTWLDSSQVSEVECHDFPENVHPSVYVMLPL